MALKLASLTRHLLVVYLVVIVAITALAVGWLKLNHMQLVSVQTGSMAPTFEAGSLLAVKVADSSELKVGRVVTFVSPASGRNISHRIVALDNARRQLTTRGDHETKPDTPIGQSAVVGRVVAVLPEAGKALDFLRKPIGLATFLYLPALAIVTNEIRALSKHYSRGYYRLLSWH